MVRKSRRDSKETTKPTGGDTVSSSSAESDTTSLESDASSTDDAVPESTGSEPDPADLDDSSADSSSDDSEDGSTGGSAATTWGWDQESDPLLTDVPGTPSSEPEYEAPLSVLAQNEAGFSLLRQWATKHGFGADPFVAGLTASVDGRHDLSAWAAMSPFDLLPHPIPRVGRGLRRVARLLHFLRNLLVFAPVALTWNAISEATEAFGVYAQTRPGETLSFLDFWQSGGADGSYLDEFHRIQNIAALDFWIIVVIIVMSLVAGLLDSTAGRTATRAERALETERIGVAIAVKRALHGKREATAESISQSLGEALTDLMNAARMVNTASLRMEAMSVGIESIGPRLEGLSERMAELNTRLGNDLQRAVDSLSTSVSRLGGTVDGELAQTLHQVLAGLDEIRDQLGKTSASVEFGTKNLRDDLEAIHSQLTGVTRGGRG